MADFPPLGHVALTVRSCDASRPWYQALFGDAPVLDEDTGPFHHVVWALPGGSSTKGSFPVGPANEWVRKLGTKPSACVTQSFSKSPIVASSIA